MYCDDPKYSKRSVCTKKYIIKYEFFLNIVHLSGENQPLKSKSRDLFKKNCLT